MCTEKNVAESPRTYSCVKQSPSQLVIDNVLDRCGVPTQEQLYICRPILNQFTAFQRVTILPQKASFGDMIVHKWRITMHASRKLETKVTRFLSIDYRSVAWYTSHLSNTYRESICFIRHHSQILVTYR